MASNLVALQNLNVYERQACLELLALYTNLTKAIMPIMESAKMVKLYKLTTQSNHTRKGEYNECLWGPNVTHSGTGKGDLCGPGYIHAYTSPLLAVLLNPIHANLSSPKLWEAEGDVAKIDMGLKVGCVKLTVKAEIPLPTITIRQRIIFAILCARSVSFVNSVWDEWADAYINKTQSKVTADAAARAAVYAAADAAAYAAVYAAAYATHAAARAAARAAAHAAADAAAYAAADATHAAARAAVYAAADAAAYAAVYAAAYATHAAARAAAHAAAHAARAAAYAAASQTFNIAEIAAKAISLGAE